MNKKYSVLMSVYYKEKPEHLRQSMESIFQQTVPTDNFVLVCDGPLTKELDVVIESMQNECLQVVRLKKNNGLGKALNEGMKYCKHELVARMDSDDISRSDRCERELKIFEENPDIDIVSGTIEEFVEDKKKIVSRRVLPKKHEEIVKFAKKRNPFNHPAVMYRKSAVEKAGGYRDFHFLEDYYLWIRMIMKGSKGYNISEPVLWMRVGADLYKRRGGWKYIQAEKELFNWMVKENFIKPSQYRSAMFSRTIGAMMPNRIRGFLYKMILRK